MHGQPRPVWSPKGPVRLAKAIAVAAVLSAPVAPALGDVVEIGPDGALTVYNAPAIFTADGAHPFSSRPAAMPAPPPANAAITGAMAYAARRYALSLPLLESLAWRESRFHHDAVSSKGAVGIMQLMPATARDLGVDRYDLSQNILGGAAYLREMLDRFGGDLSLALAAYNSGPDAVTRYRGIPPFPETRGYVKAIAGADVAANPPSVLFVDP